MRDPARDAEDAQEMLALAKGDNTALGRLMDTWSQPLFAYLSRLTSSTATAKDLMQEAFVRVYRHRYDFRSGQAFSPWLFAIATNLARNHARWHGRHPEVLLGPEALGSLPGQITPDTPETQAMARERVEALQTAVSRLPEDMREALILSTWHEMSHGEIAKVQGTSEKAVELRIYRARKLLRESLAAHLD